MAKKHLKRLFAPKQWSILRKTNKFITRPNCGPHSLGLSFPLGLVLTGMTKSAKTGKEAKFILNRYRVLVDGKRRTDFKFPVGVMDTVTINESNESYRMLLSSGGKLGMVKIPAGESSKKPCKIIGKRVVLKGLVQINLGDGRNILLKPGEGSDYHIGDTVLIDVPSQNVTAHFALKKNACVFLVGGKHSGDHGEITDIFKNKILYKNKSGEKLETLKKYCFVIGNNREAITLPDGIEQMNIDKIKSQAVQ